MTTESRGIYTEEQYALEFPGVTVTQGEEETIYPQGYFAQLSNMELGFHIWYQPKESWLPPKEVAYYQGTCNYQVTQFVD